MSTTAMKVYEPDELPGLDPESDAVLALRENLDGDSFGPSDLIRVKTPTGGSTIWTIEGPAGAEAVKTIEGICVYKGYKGIIWASLDDTADKNPPVVTSNDLKIGKLNFNMDEGIPDYVSKEMMETLIQHELPGRPGYYDWAKLPYTQWGTGKKGRGKYAKEHMQLFILRPQLGEVLPLFIQAGVASVKVLKQFFLHVGMPYHWAFISLGLTKEENEDGQPYAKIEPKLTGKVPEQYRAAIETMYKSKLKESHEQGLIDATTAAGE